MLIDLSWIKKFYPSDEVLSWLQTKFYESSSGNWWLDYWLIAHILSGGILAFFIKRPLWVLGILIGFELIENFILVPQMLAQPETVLNSIIDILVSMGGWFLADRYIT